MKPQDMEEFIERLPAGDLEALESLYRDFHHAVFSFSLSILRDRALAEDNAQDVFLRVLAKASSYRRGGNPKSWIMGIAHNLALDRLRRTSRETGIDDVPEDALVDVDPASRKSEEQIDLWHALESLDPADRQIVLLKALAELPAKDVGRLLGMPPSTVHWRYRRSLKRLATLM